MSHNTKPIPFGEERGGILPYIFKVDPFLFAQVLHLAHEARLCTREARARHGGQMGEFGYGRLRRERRGRSTTDEQAPGRNKQVVCAVVRFVLLVGCRGSKIEVRVRGAVKSIESEVGK